MLKIKKKPDSVMLQNILAQTE